MGIGRVFARLAPRIARTAIRHAPKIAQTAGRMARLHSPQLIKQGIKYGLTEGWKMAVDKIIEEQDSYGQLLLPRHKRTLLFV